MLRAVYKSQNESLTYEELLIPAKLPTLYNRRLQNIAVLMYKVKYRMASKSVFELFMIKSTHQRRLRNCDFELPRFDTVAYGCATKGLSFRQRSLDKAQLAFKEHIRGVDLSSHKKTIVTAVT